MQKLPKIFSLLVLIITLCFPPATVCAQDTQADTTSPAFSDNEDLAERPGKGNHTGSIMNDVIYGSEIDFQGAEQKLAMDVYKPSGTEKKNYPLVLLIHGGGFRTGDKKHLAETCEALADNGYVAVSINYRLGWGSGLPRKKSCGDTAQLKEAIYRASQDAHTALRYLAQHADEYSIDKNWFFIGGQSAGAVTALITAYLSQKDAVAFFPELKKDLGDLEKIDPKDAGYTLRGVLSMWGAFVDPALITSSNALPTIFFQGEKDPAVPFNIGPFASCPGTTPVYGTYPLYNRLKELGVTTIAHVDPNGGHGVYSLNFRMANILCFLKTVREGNKKQIYLTGEQGSCD